MTEANSFLLGGLPAVPRAQKQSITFKAEAFRTSLRSTHHQAPLISAVLPSDCEPAAIPFVQSTH